MAGTGLEWVAGMRSERVAEIKSEWVAGSNRNPQGTGVSIHAPVKEATADVCASVTMQLFRSTPP